MLESGRLESTQLVGFDQTPIVLKDSLLLRVPTDRLRRKFMAFKNPGRSGLSPTIETAYLTSGAMDGAAQANPSEP
jgi:hypothetical protein